MKILLDEYDFVIAVKPAGVLSEAAGEDGMPYLLEKELGSAVYPVHRLDRAVGGVMIYAKSKESAALLSAPGAIGKEYIAVVHGTTEESGKMRDLLFKDARTNKSFVVKRPRRGVREASLTFRTLETKDDLSLVSIRLETGRSHQIRVQFSSRRHPLVGDGKYGASDNCPIALFSRKLTVKAGGRVIEAAALPDGIFPWNGFDMSIFGDEGVFRIG